MIYSRFFERAWKICLFPAVASLVLIVADCSVGRGQVVREFQRLQLTPDYYSEGIAVGDINADGRPDVVYGPYWFAGPEFEQRHEIYPARIQPTERYADSFFSWVYDFDGDGANDVLFVGFPGTAAYVFQNPGKGLGEWKKYQVLDWVSNESPQWIDLVGDAQPELVCTRDGFFGFATFDRQRPFESWTFHPVSKQVAASKFGHGLGVGDVNGDERQDILHAGGWYEQPEKGALNGRWSEHQVRFSSSYGGADMYAFDVDGDGDNDVVTSEAAHDFGLSWYEQQSPGQFERHPIMGAHPSENKYGVVFSELHSLQLADMDGDGLQDLVTGKTYWSHHKQSPMWDAGAVVTWFKLVRKGGEVDWLPYQADGTTGIGRQVTVADINGDGNLDIATGGMLGAHVLLQEPKRVPKSEFLAAQPKAYAGPKLRIVDSAQAVRGSRSPVEVDGRVAEAIEGEMLNAVVTRGSAKPQGMGGFSADQWSGASQLWWTGGQPGDRLSVELDVFEEIEALQLAMTCARDYAIVQVQLNGQPLGDAIDLYSSEVVSTGLLEFPTPKLQPGKHKLTFEIVGANAKADKAYMFGLDFIRFRGKGRSFSWPSLGLKPMSRDGRELNLDFETGTLQDWHAQGKAFEGQPIRGDTVSRRRNDMRSRHLGEFWIGGYERHFDKPTGTLTSEPFVAVKRFASFYLAGGASADTRVELIAVGEEKPFFSVSGQGTETLSQVVVDLRRVENREMIIRLVDQATGGWGHINFDHFRLHSERPGPLTPPSVQLSQDEYPHSGLSAEAAAAAMIVPEGFQVTVCASEPDVRQPIAMAIDDRGRTWIAEAYEYPQRAKGDHGQDRILIFEDTTGDGKFDSRKIFAEGLNLVSGLEVGFGGVWVGAAPYLMFIPDRDGDDHPDAEPEILLDGWGYHDTHETLNAFCWGPDGWLYGCHGVFTHSKVGKLGSRDDQRIPLNAGVWRYHPTRHQFEVFAHGTSNPWGVDFNSVGDAFVTACVIPHLYHIIPGARYQRQAGQHFNPHTYDDIKTIADHLHYLGATPHTGNGKSDEVGGGHAHAGAMIYQGGKWPERFRGALLMNNIHGQRLNTDLLRPAGSGYVGEHGPDFLLTQDMASQILNFRYGPDGQVLMIDWYDMQACHRREVEVHDRSNGRIFKVSYVGDSTPGRTSAGPIPTDLNELADIELAELCLHDNNWYVRHARRILQERASTRQIDVAATDRLENLAIGNSELPQRLRAIWARYAVGRVPRELFYQLLEDPHEHIRRWAIRLLVQQHDYQLSNSESNRLTELAASDPSPLVRLAIASALIRMPTDQRWETVQALADHASDQQDHNLPLMIWYAMEPLADEDPDRALATALTAGNTMPLLREYMLRRLGGTGGRQAMDRLVAGLQQASTDEVRLTFLKAIASALEGQRVVAEPKGWKTVSAQLLSRPSEDLQMETLSVGIRFQDADAASELNRIVQDSGRSAGLRCRAIEALLSVRYPGLDDQLIELIDSETSSEVRLASIRGIAQYTSDDIGVVLIGNYGQMDSEARRATIAALSSRAAWAKLLLNAIGSKKIAASDLTADFARQLQYLGDPVVDQLLTRVWGKVSETSAERGGQIEKYRQLVSRVDLPNPDLTLGRTLFSKTCQRCHVLYGLGEKLGPDLTGSNRSNLDYLLENIVDPSAVMANEYRQSIFLTVDSQVITGIVRNETDVAVTIQTAESTVVLPQDEIEHRKASRQSMMPENQLQQLSEHEIRSLIAYLRGKSQVPLEK